MSKKNLSIVFISILFLLSIIFVVPHDKIYQVTEVNSPTSFILNKGVYTFKDLETFDSKFTPKNKEFAQNLGISEEEAFVLGNLGRYWTSSFMKGRKVFIKGKADLIYYKYSYKTKLLYSGFCLVDSKPYYKEAFEKKLAEIRRAKYKVLDLNTDKVYELNDPKVKNLENFILVRKSHLLKITERPSNLMSVKSGNIKVLVSDSTSKLKADRYCSTSICKEILNNINNAQKTIDLAIYGYSKVYTIEDALKNAIKRGVKIRLVYDMDNNGKNIYPDTKRLLSIISQNKHDGFSAESKNIMHNKFYIFDDKILITGSANLSHTDMSGFNSNSIVIFESPALAKIYKQEFEQMYSGKFHNDKISHFRGKTIISDKEVEVYFSPQDKSITNAVLPLIQNAKKYIYIPTFVLTEKRVTEELIRAKQRGVDVKIIIDALNASIRHSKHNELRQGGLQVKTENYAGKMHSKSMIIDDLYTIVGSMNFSNSGENKNDENLVVIKDSEITKFYKDFFIYQWNRIDDRWLKTNVRAEGKDSIGSCYDGIDNNYDGLTDINDVACK